MEYRYRGIPTLKNPFDLALYPRLLEQVRPHTLIEIGSFKGGSALWFAEQALALDLPTQIVSIDCNPVTELSHPRITFMLGDAHRLRLSLSDAFLAELPRPWLVIEDSDHRRETSLAVLRFFDAWLKPGEYIVVEDGILSDMRVARDYNGGPAQAIHEFLREKPDRYVIDRSYCDYFGRNVTWNVDGYLRRVR